MPLAGSLTAMQVHSVHSAHVAEEDRTATVTAVSAMPFRAVPATVEKVAASRMKLEKFLLELVPENGSYATFSNKEIANTALPVNFLMKLHLLTQVPFSKYILEIDKL